MNMLTRLFAPKPETLTAMLVPKDHLGRGLNPRDAEEFFSPYLKIIGDDARWVYHQKFSVERPPTSDSRIVDLVLKGEGVKISYTASPLLEGQGQNIYTGILNVAQTPLDLTQAGGFLRRLMDDFHLAYKDEKPHFAVFHAKGNKTLNLDRELLQQMGLNPIEAVKYYFLPGITCWSRVDVSLSQFAR